MNAIQLTFDSGAGCANGDSLKHSQRRMLVRAAMAVLVVALIAGGSGYAKATAYSGDPMTVAKGVVNQALSILQNKSMPVAERRAQLRAVVGDNFDFTAMSRSALGYQWRKLTPQQRADFTKLFSAFIVDAYLSKINDYHGQQVAFAGEKSLGQGYSQVESDIVQQGKQPIRVNYLLLQKGDSWKIYDVTVDAISIIANYRNQFNRVINERGFAALMNDLRSKQQQLAQSLGESPR